MNHLCMGCGVCTAACPGKHIEIPFDRRLGVYNPVKTQASCNEACSLCEKVCPFVPENQSTNDLTCELFAGIEGVKQDGVLGYYLTTRAGYSVEHRKTSASGGLATWMLTALLESGQVSHVISVGPDEHAPTLFSFRVCKSVAEIRACSGSCYQPVELSKVLRYVLDNDGRYAIMVLPCMAKALRLAMRVNSRLGRRLICILGLTCGQVKSRHFVDYIAERFAERPNPVAVQFRTKRSDRPATDFAFRFVYRDQETKNLSSKSRPTDNREIGWSDGINHVWSSRWFALEACDYCDDVFAECADAVFMDAWLPEYEKDWQGTSLVVTRNVMMEKLLKQGMTNGAIKCEDVSPEKVLESQEGVILQKRILTGCNYEAARAGLRIPMPRYKAITAEHRKRAFVKRNVRACLQNGPSSKALKRVTWLTSAWGWRYAKLYSLIPWLRRKRSIKSD